MSEFHLQIVTPEGEKFDGMAQALHLRSSEGYVSIRARHADYVAVLDIGVVTVTVADRERKAACGGGFLSVQNGEARLVATTFEYAEDIDAARAEAAKERAEARISAAKERTEMDLAKAKLARALNRLKLTK
jgi:F-type H+-transporting ATPase subunit epsilon